MKEFLEFLVKGIVSKPDQVKIEEVTEEGLYTYRITVDSEDMGIVIGKEGKNIKSIRELAKAKAIKAGIRINVYLEEVEKNA